MIGEAFRRQLVAGGPVVDIWQETLYLAHADVEVFRLCDDESVKLVFFEVMVWQPRQK